jgi:hypothetical protein
MMNRKKVTQFLVVAFATCFFSNAWAVGPCEQIIQACQQAGFGKDESQIGKGIRRDCVNPIMQGVPGPGMPLPAIAPTVVTACHAKRPKFGEGKVGK